MDETFAESIVHARRPHRVLGRKLRPFAYWHAAGLDFIESPFFGHPGRRDLAALSAAVDICTSQWPHFNLRVPRFPRLSAATLQYRFAKRLPLEMRRFAAYLTDYRSSPVYGTSESSKPLQTPWYLYSVVQLTQSLRISRGEAWMMPMGEGNWWNAAAAEARGDQIEILTPELREAFEKAGVEV